MYALRKIMYGIFILMVFTISLTNCEKSSIAPTAERELSTLNSQFQAVIIDFVNIGKKYGPKLGRVEMSESFLKAVSMGKPAEKYDIDQILDQAGIEKEEFFTDIKTLETKAQHWLEMGEAEPRKISLTEIEHAVQQLFQKDPDLFTLPAQSLLPDEENQNSLEVRRDCKSTCMRKFNNCIVGKTALGIFKAIGCGVGAFSATVGTIDICLGCGGTIVWGLCAPTVSVIYGIDLVGCAETHNSCVGRCR